MSTLSEPTEKPVSKTGMTGAALALYGLIRLIKPEWADGLPVGTVEVVAGFLVMIFRRISDGKSPKVV